MYTNLLINKRFRPSKVAKKLSIAEETESDRARLIFSNSFRRLNKKAQVFGLDDNSAVRNRLTHSIEVSHIGRTIAKKVSRQLLEEERITPDQQLAFIDIIETSCLLHDIGNPPFGHFGEHTIRKWVNTNLTLVFKKHDFTQEQKKIWNSKLKHDFLEFDGNAQGYRIISLLQWSISEHGLNLSYPQLAASLKYLYAPYQFKNKLYKKPGFFYAEEHLKKQIWKELKLKSNQKFPLNFIVEAADDIAYCLSDIDDALEKNLFTELEIKQSLFEIIKNDLDYEKVEIKKYVEKLFEKNEYFWFKVNLNNDLVRFAADKYISNHDDILKGEFNSSLLGFDSKECIVLDLLKNFAKRNIYKTREAENIELTGFSVISSILDFFTPLLSLKLKKNILIDKLLEDKKYDLERRLWNRLHNSHKKAYYHNVQLIKTPQNKLVLEFYFRLHLIIDFVAGMTDSFALQFHQMIIGTNINADI